MSIGKRSTEDASTWKNGETGSAIGNPISAREDGVRSKDMAEILDAGLGENHSPHNSHAKDTIPLKQSWIKRLLQMIRDFLCGKVALVSIVTAICSMQVQAYQTETVNGIQWKFTHPSSTTSCIYGYRADNGSGYETAIPTGTTGDIVIPSSLGGCPVTRVAEYAFYSCKKITSVVIPDTVTYIGKNAFQWCEKLEKIVIGKSVTSVGQYAFHVRLYYNDPSSLKTIIIKGGRISVDNNMYCTDRREGITVYVSSKWTLPSTWEGYSVKYYDPIPAIGSAVAKNLKEALYDATDGRLKSLITTEEQYNSFRSWANGVVGTLDMAQRQTVKDSSFAWLSYALDADSLITKTPEQGEVSIERFAPNVDEAKAFDLDVAIDGISVGANATAANLSEVFKIEGSTSPNGTYSSDDVEVTFGTPSEGKVKCTARPKDATKTSFFMKVKMNP